MKFVNSEERQPWRYEEWRILDAQTLWRSSEVLDAGSELVKNRFAPPSDRLRISSATLQSLEWNSSQSALRLLVPTNSAASNSSFVPYIQLMIRKPSSAASKYPLPTAS